MAISGGPDIVEDGLVLHLDAADRNSYPGTGSTWYNLSASGNNGTLSNPPTYSTASGGIFDFNGDANRVDALNPLTTEQEFTYSIWVNPDVIATNSQGILGRDAGANYRIEATSGYGWRVVLSFARRTMEYFDLNPNNWTNLVFMVKSSVAYIYLNGNLESSFSFSGTVSHASNLWIGQGYYDDTVNSHFDGKIGVFSIYNTYLTTDKITQNYNAIKGRFGL
jgi:hypothetical protein